MKLIIAYIQPEKLGVVKKELDSRKVHRMSVTRAKGCGQQRGYVESYRGSKKEITLLSKIRLEIAVNDDFIDTTVEGIVNAAKTGNFGDGKIFVLPLDECIQIRTGETGPAAIGGISRYVPSSKDD
ncbi:MAG: P-II family nitrogen regulator [Candidatus Altiarchaeota archaeon]|nr:P-II family nitrogen regulator [Candidatus Altiarchaeota archaeon]